MEQLELPEAFFRSKLQPTTMIGMAPSTPADCSPMDSRANSTCATTPVLDLQEPQRQSEAAFLPTALLSTSILVRGSSFLAAHLNPMSTYRSAERFRLALAPIRRSRPASPTSLRLNQ